MFFSQVSDMSWISIYDTHLFEGRLLIVTGWTHSQDTTTARLEVGWAEIGPTPEQVHRCCGSAQLSQIGDGKANQSSSAHSQKVMTLMGFTAAVVTYDNHIIPDRKHTRFLWQRGEVDQIFLKNKSFSPVYILQQLKQTHLSEDFTAEAGETVMGVYCLRDHV